MESLAGRFVLLGLLPVVFGGLAVVNAAMLANSSLKIFALGAAYHGRHCGPIIPGK